MTGLRIPKPAGHWCSWRPMRFRRGSGRPGEVRVEAVRVRLPVRARGEGRRGGERQAGHRHDRQASERALERGLVEHRGFLEANRSQARTELVGRVDIIRCVPTRDSPCR